MQTKTLVFTDYVITVILALAFTAAPYYINYGYCSITLGYAMSSLAVFTILLMLTYVFRETLI